mgnify:CR=1 FL=1
MKCVSQKIEIFINDFSQILKNNKYLQRSNSNMMNETGLYSNAVHTHTTSRASELRPSPLCGKNEGRTEENWLECGCIVKL